ncbi:MAG: beta-galactosidase [Anaerolineae bacterium]
MQRDTSFRPVTPRPVGAGSARWLLPVILLGGSVVSVTCAAAFVVFAFMWQPPVPTPQVEPPTPGGQVVRFVREQPQQSAVVAVPTPTPLPPSPTPPIQAVAPPVTPVELTPGQPAVQPAEQPAGEAPAEEATPTPAPKPTKPKQAPAPSAGAPNRFAYAIQVDPDGASREVVEHIKQLGIKWVKFQLSWEDIEPGQGQYNWGAWDQIMLTYHQAGFYILLSVVKAPDWARPANTDFSQEGPPADPKTFARFLGEMLQRYRTGVQAIEVWNEQNLAREGGGAPMPPAEYVALLSAAYRTIKLVDPSVIVVSGAPTPAGDVPGAAIDDIRYLEQMYAAGLKNVSDAIGVHPSGYNCPADADWQTVSDPTARFRGPFENRHHSWCFRGTMEGYRNVMVANGDADKLLWPTEFGWAVANPPPPNYEYAADNTYEEQAQWIVSAYQQAQAWGWVGPMFLWNLNYGVTKPGSEQAAFSILTPSGPTPAYQALLSIPK